MLGFIDSGGQNSNKNVFWKSQVLFGKLRPYLRKYWQATFNGVCSTEIWVLNGIQVNNKYLFQLIQTNKFNQIANVSSGSKMPRADWKYMEYIPFSIPSKSEQQKIAAFLTAVDDKIQQLTEKQALLQRYKKGVMQQIFSQKIRFKADDGRDFPDWEEKRFYNLLEDVLDFRGRTPIKLGMAWGNGKIISLSANNVKDGYIDFESECNLGSKQLYEKWMGKVNLEKNDIVFTMEAPLGKSLLIPDSNKYILSQRVVAFKTKSNITNKFLIQLIWSQYFQNKINKLSTGTTAKGINQKSLKKLKVSIPSFPEQQKIANFLTALDDKINTVTDQLTHMQTFKKGLLQQMFV